MSLRIVLSFLFTVVVNTIIPCVLLSVQRLSSFPDVGCMPRENW